MNSLYISNKLLKWYENEKRDLPWRIDPNPYHVWISEIIMQQTRVSQGTNYYLRFLEKFPDLPSLAAANEDDVLKLWQGLGYYSRARNLHFAAQQMMNNFDGKFPETFLELKKIKGIGDYTAGAIASIAFNVPVAAVDGNVYRVLSRLFGIEEPIDISTGKKIIHQLASELVKIGAPGDYNQAVMEFGAMVCKPKQPLCSNCIFINDCHAFSSKKVHLIPVKSKKVKQQYRYFYYLYLESNQWIWFKKRTERDIWLNLFDFPLIETANPLTPEEIIEQKLWQQITFSLEMEINKIGNELIHILSHQKICIRFIELKFISENNLPSNFIKIDKRNIFELAVPKVIENFLKEKKLI